MKIGLIAMSGVRVRNEDLARLGLTLPQFVSRGKVIASLPSLGLLTVAGLTPPEHDVAYREIADLRPDHRDAEGVSGARALAGRAQAQPERRPPQHVAAGDEQTGGDDDVEAEVRRQPGEEPGVGRGRVLERVVDHEQADEQHQHLPVDLPKHVR